MPPCGSIPRANLKLAIQGVIFNCEVMIRYEVGNARRWSFTSANVKQRKIEKE